MLFRSVAWGRAGDLPHPSPRAVWKVHRPPGRLEFYRCPASLRSVAAAMSSLKIVPVLRRCLLGRIAELPPPADRAYLVNHEGQRIPGVRRLVVVDRSQPAAADTAGRSHGFESGPMFAAQIAVLISWIACHGGGSLPSGGGYQPEWWV